jgi:hypothetical protein
VNYDLFVDKDLTMRFAAGRIENMDTTIWFPCHKKNASKRSVAFGYNARDVIVEKRMQTIAAGEDNVRIAAAEFDANTPDKLQPAQVSYERRQIDERST